MQAIISWFELREKNNLFQELKQNHDYNKIQAWIYVISGIYYEFSCKDINKAKENYTLALKIIETLPKSEDVIHIKFNASAQLSQILAFSGDTESADHHLKYAENQVNLLKGEEDLGLLKFIKAKILSEKGKYNEALEAINENLKFDERLPKNEFTAPTLIAKSEILSALGLNQEAYNIINSVLRDYIPTISPKHELKGRVLNALSVSEIGIGKFNDARIHMLQAKEIFLTQTRNQNKSVEDSIDDEFAQTMVLEGDLYYFGRKLFESNIFI